MDLDERKLELIEWLAALEDERKIECIDVFDTRGAQGGEHVEEPTEVHGLAAVA